MAAPRFREGYGHAAVGWRRTSGLAGSSEEQDLLLGCLGNPDADMVFLDEIPSLNPPGRQRVPPAMDFEAEGVGLLGLDDSGGVRSAVPASRSPIWLPCLQERGLELMKRHS